MAELGRRYPGAPSYAQLEESLDRTIGTLASATTTREARALLIEARRLRSIVANWHSISPSSDVHGEMVDRVLHLATAAGANAHSHEHEEARDVAREVVDEGGSGHSWTDPDTQRRPESRSARPHIAVAAAVAEVVVEAEPVIHGEPVHVARATSEPPRAHVRVQVPEAQIVDEPTPDSEQPTKARASALGLVEVRVVELPMPPVPDPRLVMLADPYSDRADAYRSLCRKLAASGSPRVIAVTSAEPGEGKTMCAANLALALREGARGRVLLAEANLRSPSLAALFGFSPPSCFDEQLRRRPTAPDAPWDVVEQIPKLHLLAVDPARPHAPMLEPAAFAASMDALKLTEYDYIVIDTPPVLGGAAVNLVADHIDGIVLAVTTQRTTRRALKKAVDQLNPAPILGVVLIEGA